MRRAEPGDVVLSYANARVGHVGIVSGRALEEGKPKAFGTAGERWSDDGWWLPVEWTPLRHPVAAKPLAPEMRSLLPKTHSPILATGDGNRGAYLAAISEALFNYVIARSGTPDWAAQIDADTDLPIADQVEDGHLGYDAALGASERIQLGRARRGQGLFRFRVFQVEEACRLTGIKNPDLLIASHIKPWSLCATTHERLDGFNGLVLTPHVDRLFDRRLISFTDSGDVICSKRLSKDDLRRLGLEDACNRNVGDFSPEQRVYLDFHRTKMKEREAQR